MPVKPDFSRFPDCLLNWYDHHARILPWRDHPSPYRVWISEIMLQQTRVETVIPYFERFVRAIPSVEALADIPDSQLLKLWEGLGYYSRALNLKKAAIRMVRENEGVLPCDPEQMKSLPGIGDYTAGAVLSIAYGYSIPAVDGNVIRVFSRILASAEDYSRKKVKKDLENLIQGLIPSARPGDFNQALMELGATVCLPNGEPKCTACPVAFLCKSFQEQRMTEFPVKKEKKDRRIEKKTVLFLIDEDKIAIRKRTGQGLLHGMWEFPLLDGFVDERKVRQYLESNHLSIRSGGGVVFSEHKERILPEHKEHTPVIGLTMAKHVFSHIEWHMIAYVYYVEKKLIPQIAETLDPGVGLPAETEWVSYGDLARKYAIPAAFRPWKTIWSSPVTSGFPADPEKGL